MTCMHQCTAEQWSELLTAIREREQQNASDMPDDRAALLVMFRGFDRLRQLGWRDACYCPKDGSTFEVIEAGSTGIHRAHYEGEWPKGTWWVHDNGDFWPSRPILFRLIQDPSQGTAARSAETSGLGPQGNGPVGEADAPSNPPIPTTPSSTGDRMLSARPRACHQPALTGSAL